MQIGSLTTCSKDIVRRTCGEYYHYSIFDCTSWVPGLHLELLTVTRGTAVRTELWPKEVPMALRRPTQGDKERRWRELQLAASASAGVRAATLGMFFNGAAMSC